MAKFQHTVRALDIQWNGLYFKGPVNTVFSLPDDYYEEFNTEVIKGDTGFVWTVTDENDAIETRLTDLEAIEVPVGGTTGQVLTKNSATNYDMNWASTGVNLGSTAAVALGTAAAGTGVTASRTDHVHPTTGISLSAHTHAAYLEDSDTLTGALTISNTGSLQVYGATATAATQVSTRVDGEFTTRWGVRADGFQAWGDGTASRDTNLYRSAANTLATDDNLDVGQTLTVGGDLTVGDDLTVGSDIVHATGLDFVVAGVTSTSVNSTGLYLPSGKTVKFEGTTANGYEIDLTADDATLDRTITLPNLTGTVALTSQIPPTGSIVMWATATAPTNWLFLDGTTYNQSTYPDLAAVFGVTSGTFTLPDMRDRFAAGASTVSALSNNAGTFAPNTANATAHDHTTNIAHAHADTIAVATHGDHTHSVNPAATASGGPSTLVTSLTHTAAGTAGGSSHTHTTDIAATTSAAESTNLTHTVSGGVTSLGTTSVTSSSSGGTLTPKATLLNFIIKT